MPATTLAPIGAPIWIDLFTSDTAGARAFYGSLFGWSAEEPNADFGGYFNYTLQGDRVAGCMSNDPQSGAPDMWSVYLHVDDPEATVAAGEAHGGSTMVPAMPVGDMGTMAVLLDAGGAGIGLWKPGTHRGTGRYGEHGTPAWYELQTREYAAAVDYYRDVFRWPAHTMSDTPDFRYTTHGVDDDAKAGIMDASGFLPEGVPSHWTIYFKVDDTDAAVATAVELGGSVLQPAEDTPFGRMAALADPTGATFRVMQEP